MFMNSTQCSLSNLLKCTQELSLIMRESFGPNGKAILFEQNGFVLTSQDGAEILSILTVSDSVASMVAESAISSTDQHGDGTKLFLILTSSLLASLEKVIDNTYDNVRRRKIISCLWSLSRRDLPKLQECSLSWKSGLFPVTFANKNRLTSAIYALLITKFSKNVTNILSDVFVNYIFHSTKEMSVTELETMMREPTLHVIEVPELPVYQSKIIEGFVITRTFRYRKSVKDFKKCFFMLWSCQIEDDEEKSTDKIQLTDPSQLSNTYFFQMQLLSQTLSTLSSKNISVIISSVFFPDWAVSVCARYGVAVIDMVNRKEFEYLSKVLQLSEFTSHEEANNFNQLGRATFERLHVGSSKFVKILIGSERQILVCAPTLSQCRQYATGLRKVMTYLFNWIQDSKSVCEGSRNTINLYYVPCFYTISRIYNFCCTQSLTERTVENKVLTETIQEALYVFYNQRSKYSDGKFINFLNEMKGINLASCPQDDEMIESPFLVFKILSQVVETVTQVVKIEHIIKSPLPIKDLRRKDTLECDEE